MIDARGADALERARSELAERSPHVVAIASDEAFAAPLPLLPLGDAGAVAAFITDHFGLA